MENWLVIGSGGREYAMAQKLAENTHRHIYVAPGNPMMDKLKRVDTVKIAEMDFTALVQFAKKQQINWTLVGPEQPLSAGIVDEFKKHDLNIFGPNQFAAQLESSKAFAKQIMQSRKVPTAAYQEFSDIKSAVTFIENHQLPLVIKANGLAAGKGVIIVKDRASANQAIEYLLKLSPDAEIIIEDYLAGQEFSLIVMANGTKIVPMPIAQDHKRAFNDDQGPNTGGMGAYSPVPQISYTVVKKALDNIIMPVLAEMKDQGHPFTGFLYAGLIRTNSGTQVIEFNVRMGDPETQVILPQLETDFGTLIEQLMTNHSPVAKWQQQKYYLGTVIAAKGYPNQHPDHLALPIFNDPQLLIDYAGTDRIANNIVSHGGRILMVIAGNKSLKKARDQVNRAIKMSVDNSNYEYRTDIGNKALNYLSINKHQ